jgi:mono/diheme cytochrome c family protein
MLLLKARIRLSEWLRHAGLRRNARAGPVVAAALGLGLGLGLALSHGGWALAQSASDGDPAEGKRLYYAHACYGCHGYNGETGVRDLVGTNSPIVADLAIFTAFLRQRADLAPLFPSTRMPNYSTAALSDAEARDIFAYIRTFRLNAPEVSEVPALEAILEAAENP